jgi:hypothetical protein
MKPMSACAAHPALPFAAAAIRMRPGAYVFPNNDVAIMRAGMAQDLAVIRKWRLAGEKQEARDRISFARDARIFLTAYR